MIDKTAAEIQDIVQGHVNNVTRVMGHDAEIRVPLPSGRDADGTPANWDMRLDGLPPGNVQADIEAVKELAQNTYKLVP